MLENTTQVALIAEEQTELEAKKKRQRGQGFTEYIILVGVIAILLIGTITAFKDELGSTFDTAKGKVQKDVREKMDGGGE